MKTSACSTPGFLRAYRTIPYEREQDFLALNRLLIVGNRGARVWKQGSSRLKNFCIFLFTLDTTARSPTLASQREQREAILTEHGVGGLAPELTSGPGYLRDMVQ